MERTEDCEGDLMVSAFRDFPSLDFEDEKEDLEMVVEASGALRPSKVTTSNPTLSLPCLISPTEFMAIALYLSCTNLN